jgi:hypothetical protein
MKTVIVPPGEYETGHAEAIARGDIAPLTPAPMVRRHVDVKMHCNYKHCPDPEFLAAFDEVQRIIACPSCGREVFVPEAYRGMP